MKMRDPTKWMWGEALEMLEQADRLRRQFFQPGTHRERLPTWEPPIDIFESERELAIFVALPGVAADQLRIALDDTAITIRGQRTIPETCKRQTIRRLEIPYGRFERRIELPAGQFQIQERSLKDGCLVLILHKLG
ncbi:MAG TPA: Hsp20/alpha crystallin family protein [Burkholderiaceae bacterium]|nr:Hsp20/alpha crystallin family protein [Burkholderiaceae bacterium]